MFNCDVCNKEFSVKTNLYSHKSKVHRNREFVCYYCGFSTKFKNSLGNHIYRTHSQPRKKRIQNTFRGQKFLICTLCYAYQSQDRTDVLEHYVREHDIPIYEDVLTFDNPSDFAVWRKQTETDSLCRFVMAGGTRTRKHGTVQYLRCFRDGIYSPRGRNERRLKKKGSNKINSVCPASITVTTDSSGPVTVKYISSHVGHSADSSRFNSTVKKKKGKAIKLTEGQQVSREVIHHEELIENSSLEFCRLSADGQGKEVEREIVISCQEEDEIEELIVQQLPRTKHPSKTTKDNFPELLERIFMEFRSIAMSAINCEQLRLIRKHISKLPLILEADKNNFF